mgnify:CR=1 FL=1
MRACREGVGFGAGGDRGGGRNSAGGAEKCGVGRGVQRVWGDGPAADKGIGGFGAHVAGDGALEHFMGNKGAADEANAGGARAIGSQAFDAGLDDFRVIGEAEVAVGAEAECLAELTVVATDLDGGVHRAIDDAEVLVLAAFTEGVEEGGGTLIEDGGLGGGHGGVYGRRGERGR